MYNMNTDRTMPPTVQEASSATYTAEQLKEFLERNWNTIRDQSRYLVEGTETAVRCAYCKEVVELGEDPSQREVNWAAHVELDHKRRFFIDDPHCALIPGFEVKVFCSPCNKEIELTYPWKPWGWQKHIKTLFHRRNVGEVIPNTPSDMRRKQFVEDPAAVVLSNMEIGCLLCGRKIKLNDPWAWQNWELHSKSKDHQAKAGAWLLYLLAEQLVQSRFQPMYPRRRDPSNYIMVYTL
ncbi:hypothetical protein DFP72DRAFT_864429 [Ephemerocybe angulata]|uniref:Uncharacterized protein n=1 Tax=Ephemerocybe angulata TaxID=980116 RepID=A0A8H6H5J2_9AGAR|nr:hypothetical protein DFP72DRAFT_864429 [Tulosesus angulatus]